MEEEKRGRGRPKKKATPVINEEQQQITMSSSDNASTSKAEISRDIKNGVGIVKDVPERITLDAIQQRWRDVFKNYGSLGFDTLNRAWNDNVNFLNNPFLQNNRVKQINSPVKKLTKDEMQNAVDNPEYHETTLRSVSMGLYYTNYIYQNLIQLNRNTPKYNYYATPLYTDGPNFNKEDLRKDSKKVDKILKSFNPQLIFKTIATQVNAQGKCSYLVRTSYNKNDVDFLLLQKLNSEMVKITGFGSKQQFVASFNMGIFLEPAYDVSQYPQFIRDTWEEMIKQEIVVEDKKTRRKKVNPKAKIPRGHMLEGKNDGSYMYWVKLPQDLCYTFYSDGAHPNAFPDTIGLFADLNDLADYRWLQGNLLSKGVNSVLTAEVPIVKDPKAGSDATVISPDTILGYQDFFAQNISANIFPFFAPFEKFELHTLENQPESMDIIYSRIRDLIATSGNSALLPITDKPSIASVKAAQSLQASKNDYLTRQFQSFLNNVINENFDLKYTWNVTLWGDVFFWRDDVKITKELVISGMHGLLPKLLSAQDQSLEDYKGATIYMDALDIKIKTAEEVKQELNNTNPVGRPKLNDSDIENDNTGTSNDQGNNVSEIKMSASLKCAKCNRDLESHENIICDECLQEAYEERLAE